MPAASRFGRKSQIGFVLLAALAIESVNFFLGSPAVDPGPQETQWYTNLLALQWVALHAVGIFMTDWVDRMGFPRLAVPALFLGGYATTVVVLVALVFIVQRVVRWIGRPERRRRRRSGPAL
ncbi:hypothetical protein [Terriglobus saanensis]|nr:hypothetical protein [Terriglobus saanensis]